jgi:hypothetical protein
MKKFNASNYYYLANNKTINKEDINVGATLFDGKWITNYTEASEINVEKYNKISIYVPSTINVNKVNPDFENLTQDTIKKLQENFNTDVQRYNTQGAWKAEDGEIVYENINILTIGTTEENFESTLNYFISLAEQFKKDLSQEGISIGINNGLLII